MEVALLIAVAAVLAACTRFPYWPSLLVLGKAIAQSGLPLRAKKEQARYVMLQILLAPLRGAASLIDELFFYRYRRVHIEPIFIIGEPRCGSTLLHRTMALSGHHLAVRHYEWRYPFVICQKLFQWFKLDAAFANISYWPQGEIGSEAAKMHPDRLSDWEEDGIFFEENFCHHFFMFLRFPCEGVLRHGCDFSSLPARHQKVFLKEHKKAIQKIAYYQGYKQISYLSKEVVSHEMIPHLLAEYPNARFVITVRKSGEFLSSLIPLARASTMAKNAGFDPSCDPRWQQLILERIGRDCELLVDLCKQEIPAERQYRLPAVKLFADITSTICDLYQWLGIELDQNYLSYLISLASNQTTRERGYVYESHQFDGFADYDRFVEDLIAASQFPSQLKRA